MKVKKEKPDFKKKEKPAFKKKEKPDFKKNGKPDFKKKGKPDFKKNGKPDFKKNGKPDFKKKDKADFNKKEKSDFKINKKPAFKKKEEDEDEDEEVKPEKLKHFNYESSVKWYDELPYTESSETIVVNNDEVQQLKKEAQSIFNEAVLLNKSKTPKSITGADYAWLKTVLAKGTKTDKIAAYTLLIQDAPLYNLSYLRNIVELVKIGKNKECFMAVDTLCELFLNDLLPPNRKLLTFPEQPLSKLNEPSSGNAVSRKRKLLLWYFEDQLKSIFGEFVTYLSNITHDSVIANKAKVITAMCKLLTGHPEKENVLLNSIVNKIGDPSHKIGSKVIYSLSKVLESHPNMRAVVVEAVEKVIFRTNISKRAQYYSICFLSHFCFFKEDSELAKNLIFIYLSLFKACIKTGDVDSRMMSALLTGVKRAYPFAKEELGMLKEHIDTIYKVIHLSHANISIQALCLIYLISDYSNSFVDRFYTVLYKKVGEPEMYKSTHHAMLLSLIFKALKKDNENARVCAFLKRLLQVCMYIPVPVACGVLIMVSEIIKLKKDVLVKEETVENKVSVKLEDDSDDGEEHYKDVVEEHTECKNEEPVEVEEEKPKINLGNIYNTEENKKLKVWTNPDNSGGEKSEVRCYNPFVRNPLFAGADKTLSYELFKLSKHFHPTISLFANKIINGEKIVYSGDPFLDFTLIRFLDKFSFKNPKTIKEEDEKSLTFSMFSRKKYYTSDAVRRLRANTAEYLNCSEQNIPVDEMFLYKFMKKKSEGIPISDKKDDNSDVESVGSDEFEEILSGLADGGKDDINFLSEVGKLPAKTKSKKGKKNESDEDSDDEGSEEGEDFDEDEMGDDSEDEVEDEEDEDDGDAEDFDGDEMEDDFGDEDKDLLGSDVDEDELEAELEAGGFTLPKLPKLNSKGTKQKFKKSGKGFKGNLFASAEEFSELLEDTDYSAGGSEAFSNKDRAGAKQIKWESDRDKWIHKKNFRSKAIGRKNQQNFNKKGKKKRF